MDGLAKSGISCPCRRTGSSTYDIDSIHFDSNGGSWSSSHTTEVMIQNTNEPEAAYLWSTSRETPDLSSTEWHPFKDSIVLTTPQSTGKWYLFVKAQVTENGTWWVRRSEPFYVDPVNPVVTLGPSNAWTNQNVEVTVTASDSESGLAELKYASGKYDATDFPADGQPLDPTDARITITENGWVSVYAKDNAGNETVEQFEITNIDRVKPVITLLGDAVMQVLRGSVFTDPGYTATDDVDGDLAGNVIDFGAEVEGSIKMSRIARSNLCLPRRSRAACPDSALATRMPDVSDAVPTVPAIPVRYPPREYDS